MGASAKMHSIMVRGEVVKGEEGQQLEFCYAGDVFYFVLSERITNILVVAMASAQV